MVVDSSQRIDASLKFLSYAKKKKKVTSSFKQETKQILGIQIIFCT